MLARKHIFYASKALVGWRYIDRQQFFRNIISQAIIQYVESFPVTSGRRKGSCGHSGPLNLLGRRSRIRMTFVGPAGSNRDRRFFVKKRHGCKQLRYNVGLAGRNAGQTLSHKLTPLCIYCVNIPTRSRLKE